MFGSSRFEQLIPDTFGDETEDETAHDEGASSPDTLKIAQDILAIAQQESENSDADETIHVPVPEDASGLNAVDIRTDIAILADSAPHPLLIAIVEQEGERVAVFQKV